jgi:hypothetical protein
MSTKWRSSQRPFARGRLLPQSEGNAIRYRLGDQAGRKSPPSLDVSRRAFRVTTSKTQRFALPPARVLTKTICLPPGDRVPWSS